MSSANGNGTNGTNGHGTVEMGETKKEASVFTPLVWILSFVCLGLLIAVVAMAAVIAGDDSKDCAPTTVVCPGGQTIVVGSPPPALMPPGSPPAASPSPSPPPPMMSPPPPSPDSPAPMCPVETMYWEYPDGVYGGYKGCVSQVGISPCAQDGYEGPNYPENPMNSPILWNPDTQSCVTTEFTPESKTLWILWGSPMDNNELVTRTGGVMPVISFPFDRAPYPSYFDGAHGDESLSTQAKQKEFLTYMDAFTTSELADFNVLMTEGAESGMIVMWAAKALELARTTCIRQFYFLMEVPAYGYSPGTSASWVNAEARSFYDGVECDCNDGNGTSTCQEPTVTLSAVGWAPGTPLPVRTGPDGNDYAADSASASSPWIESMVFPENPSGVVKTPQLPNADRRVCDGVYLYPMYFGGNDWTVPDSRPDCASWSFSITKAYSASVRAGTILFKNTYPESIAAHEDIIDSLHSMANGLYSEWSWRGQNQIWDLMMEKPYTDPTSWIGAYKTIMEDKWNLVIDGFKDCPVIELVNDYQGAYAWFKKTPEYRGLEDSWITSLFRDTLGIHSTTYNWGFRGADPADMYGEGYTTTDFTRMHLYRDISVYEEVNRRAKIMCSGGQVADHLLTYTEWRDAEFARINDSSGKRRHALAAGGVPVRVVETREDTRRRLRTAVPRLTDAHLDHHVEQFHQAQKIQDNIDTHCAPDFSMSCLMKYTGGKHAEAGDKHVLL